MYIEDNTKFSTKGIKDQNKILSCSDFFFNLIVISFYLLVMVYYFLWFFFFDIYHSRLLSGRLFKIKQLIIHNYMVIRIDTTQIEKN